MKKILLGNRLGSLAASSLAVGLLTMWASPASATTNIMSFDTGIQGWWINGWGGQGAGAAWDANQNHTVGGGGSLHVMDVWQNGDQMVDIGWWSGNAWSDSEPIDLTTYTNVSLWVKWDTTASLNELSLFGQVGEQLKLWATPTSQGGSYPWIELAGFTIPNGASNGWVNVNVPINPAIPGIATAQGLGLKKWTGTGTNGTFAFWVDDFEIQNNITTIIPPPTVTLAKPVTGLNLNAPSGPYNREMLYATNGPNSFVGHGSTPVTYSINVKQGVSGTDGSQFQTHIMIIPTAGAPLAASETAPDWNEPNAMWLDIESDINPNTTVATFRYKTNEPNGNGMAYSSTNVPAIITNTTLTGTWTLTVLNDNNFTISAPDGGSTNFTIPHDSALLFGDPAYVYFGVQANNTTAIGKTLVLSEAKITGAATAFDDVFTSDSGINPALWEKVAVDPLGTFIVTSTARFWVQWTLPDALFSLVSSPTVNSGWNNIPGATPIQLGAKKMALINQSQLPGANTGFFGLIKRQFTQLQVLLPGETNAPGTVSGKIGSPTPMTLSTSTTIPVVVNACDSQWNIVAVTGDTIQVQPTDPSSAPITGFGTLVSGTTTVTFDLFTAPASTTFTATDTSDGTKTPNTSSAVTVSP